MLKLYGPWKEYNSKDSNIHHKDNMMPKNTNRFGIVIKHNE